MTFAAHTRVCLCHALIADPAASACPMCARPLVPHHSTWPLFVKWWLAAEKIRSLFFDWKSDQRVWEELLRDALNGIRGGIGPNPNGTQLTMSTPAAELFPIALERATAWKAAGSSLSRSTDSSKVA